MDIYLLDFLLKGHIHTKDKILDIGCGEGRNLVYFMKENYDVFGVDNNEEALRFVKMLAKQYQIQDVEARFQNMDVRRLRFPDNSFDLLISSAVLHFVEDEDHFLAAISEMHRVMKKGAKLFLRCMTNHSHLLDSNIVSDYSKHITHPDQSKRFLLSEELIGRIMDKNIFRWLEPFKYVTVNNERSMSVILFKAVK